MSALLSLLACIPILAPLHSLVLYGVFAYLYLKAAGDPTGDGKSTSHCYYKEGQLTNVPFVNPNPMADATATDVTQTLLVGLKWGGVVSAIIATFSLI